MSFKKDETGYIATAHFKMPKQVKRTLATIQSKELRDQWRNCSTQAVMQSFDVIKKEKDKDKSKQSN